MCIGKVYVGEGYSARIREIARWGHHLGDSAGHVGGYHHRCVVGAVNGDGHVLRRDTGMGVIDRNGKDGGHGFTGGQEVQIPFRDGVSPVDRTVIGVVVRRGHRNREGCFYRSTLRSAQGKRRRAISL